MSGTGGQWWKADPLASATPSPSPAEVDTGWWKADPVAADIPVANGIYDDPKLAAPARTIAAASMFPNLKDRIPVYAKSFGVPASDFSIVGDHIVRKLPDGAFARVEPSVVGATGLADALQRVSRYGAGSIGPAIPAAASIAAGMATRGNIPSIVAAGGAGGAGDVVRQSIGSILQGDRPGNIDWTNAAGQAALGAGGQALGLGLQGMFERSLPGLPAADREWLRNPENVAASRAAAELLRRQGITAMRGPTTDRGSLLHADRQLMRNEETADPMRRVVRRVNTEEVPRAVGNAADRVAPDIGIDQAARDFAVAADAVKEFPRQEGNRAARPLYEPLNASRANVMTPDLAALADAPALKSALARARETYANKYGSVPDTPDFTLWDLVKKQLDADYTAAGSPFEPAKRAGMDSIDSVRSRLVGALENAFPGYGAARATARPGIAESERLTQGVVGRLAEAQPDAPAFTVLAKAFSPSSTTPTAIAESRQAFINAGKEEAWNQAFSAYVRSIADKAGRTLASGDTGNVAGKIHAELFGNERARTAVAAALGGADTPAYRQFAETMRALEITAKIPPMLSPTATDVGKTGAASSPTASAAAFGVRAANVFKWPQQLENFAQRIENSSASKAAKRIAGQYVAGPEANGALMEGLRILHPGVAGLLSGGSRGGLGLLDMLLPQQNQFEPYRPPLPNR